MRGLLAGRCHARPGVALDQAHCPPANPASARQVDNREGRKQERLGLLPDPAPQAVLIRAPFIYQGTIDVATIRIWLRDPVR